MGKDRRCAMELSDALVPRVYAALQQRASQLLRSGGGSLSPQSLVHDVLLKLYRSESQTWRDEQHFRTVAAIAMRQLLIDRARRKAAAKHGANAEHVSLTGVAGAPGFADLVDLADALEQLEAARPRAAQVVVYRLLGGLSHDEIADELGCSVTTVKREWRLGQAWMQQRLGH